MIHGLKNTKMFVALLTAFSIKKLLDAVEKKKKMTTKDQEKVNDNKAQSRQQLKAK